MQFTWNFNFYHFLIYCEIKLFNEVTKGNNKFSLM